MAGASFILAINLFIAALFALAFFLVSVNNRIDNVAGWFAVAYSCGILYIACEFVLPIQQYARPAYVCGFAAFQGVVSAILIGVSRRYRRPVPWLVLGLIGVAAVAANWFAFALDRNSILRMLAYQAPYALLQAMAAWAIVRSQRRQPMDLGLMSLFGLSALQFLSKPFVAGWTGGPGDSAQSYIASTYALYSQSLGAVLQVAIGLLMLMVLVRDVLVEITLRSETDPLSSVFNRRGFEERALPLLAAARQDGQPAAVVLADLDVFKAINDSFGHHVGDAVIVAFATLLQESAPKAAIIGRMGGEEFAVLLPGANLSSARLFAEAVRAQFSTTRIADIPADHRCTASFGVAQITGFESLTEVRRRADAALYAAKRSGRDKVCVASDMEIDVMPDHPMRTDLARSA